MKIAYVCDFYKPAIGGVNQVVEELAERLARQGHEVHVYCSDWDKTRRIKPREETINNVHVHRCWHWFRAVNFITVWPSVLWQLGKEDFDIIHSHLPTHAHSFFAAVIGKLKGIPLIHTTHCPWSDAYRSTFGKFMVLLSHQTFAKFVLKAAKKIIAITEWEDDFISKYGGLREKIVHIPNGMDSRFFRKLKNNDFKKRHNIKNKLVLFFGRLNQTKGPDKFVLAAHEILKERKDIAFVILGPDEGMKEKVKTLIGNENRIILLDPTRDKNEIIKMYQASDVYVLPSYREGLPLTLFEAYASGLPVVATPVNGVKYEMKDGVNGLFVPYGNILLLKDAILKILDNPKLARKFVENNRKKAFHHTWDEIAQKTLQLYMQAAK